jgi:hypothetical protein
MPSNACFLLQHTRFTWSRPQSRRSESFYITTMADKMNFKMRRGDAILEAALSSVPAGETGARPIRRSGQDKERHAQVRS